jgi:hypothetical protein
MGLGGASIATGGVASSTGGLATAGGAVTIAGAASSASGSNAGGDSLADGCSCRLPGPTSSRAGTLGTVAMLGFALTALLRRNRRRAVRFQRP